MATTPDTCIGDGSRAQRRGELARRALDGYPSGPAAPLRATARALARIDDAVSVVLVEGVSDQIALETAAAGISPQSGSWSCQLAARTRSAPS